MTGEEMWRKYCHKSGVDKETRHDTWKFCGGGPLADELAKLVLEGTKTATASAGIAYEVEEEAVPEVGLLNIVLFDNDEAACIIQNTKVTVVPFDEVCAEHAFNEGEGDRSLAYWKDVHRKAFAPDYEEAGIPFDEHGDCVLEEFKVVFRDIPGNAVLC